MVNYDDYDYDHESRKKSSSKKKKKSNLSRLLFIFILTFFCMLVVFLLIAKTLTPNVEVLDTINQESPVLPPDNTEDSFRKRIDSSLVDIFNDEKFPHSIIPNDEDNEEKPKDKEEIKKSPDKIENKDDQKDDSDTLDIGEDINKSKQTAPSQDEALPKKPPVPPLPEKPKDIKPVTSQEAVAPTYKVLVGSFATPEEARLQAKDMVSQGYSVTPFIRLINGRYAVQAGSFNDVEKARATANTLNHYYDGVKIVKEF